MDHIFSYFAFLAGLERISIWITDKVASETPDMSLTATD